MISSFTQYLLLSLPSLGAWIEVVDSALRRRRNESLPSLGAWIEVGWNTSTNAVDGVAPFIGSVD